MQKKKKKTSKGNGISGRHQWEELDQSEVSPHSLTAPTARLVLLTNVPDGAVPTPNKGCCTPNMGVFLPHEVQNSRSKGPAECQRWTAQ